MINKKIKKILNKTQIDKLKLNLSLRPMDVKPEMYYKITKLIEDR